MKMTIKHENDEFLGITLKHVPGLKVALNSPRTIKLWAIAHETAIKQENDEFLVISFQHVSGRKVNVNRPRTTKLWAIAHENGHKTRKRRVSGHIFPTCIRSEGQCKSP